MINNIETEQIEKMLHKISKSEVFDKSPRSVRLLKFLVKKALNGEDIKEDILGLELFKSKYNPNQKDSKVRVYMYNLRNRLKEYYADEGANDTIVFTIDKGQYNISFNDRAHEIQKQKSKKRIWISTAISVLIVLLLALYFITLSVKKERHCWDYFFKSKANTLCLISDHFIVRLKKDDEFYRYMHIEGINNERELARYLLTNTDEELVVPDFTFLTKMAPVVMQTLTKWFSAHNRDFEVIMESEFTYENMRNNNLLFAGQFKTMGDAKQLFLKDSKVFSIMSDGFMHEKDGTAAKYTANARGYNRTEYAMVSFAPLGNNKESLFFTSNHDVGVMATINNFTDKNWLKVFYKDFPEDVKYFNALFEVKGVKRTEMSCELIHIEYLGSLH